MELLKVCAFAALAHDDEVAGPLDEGVGNLPGAQGEADVPDALAFEALLGSVENGTAPLLVELRGAGIMLNKIIQERSPGAEADGA